LNPAITASLIFKLEMLTNAMIERTRILDAMKLVNQKVSFEIEMP
jgi:hypothetical protein